MSERTRPGLLTILRDVGSFLGGWIVIFKQAGILFAPPTQTSEVLILLAAVAIGIPGAAQLLQARNGSATSTVGPRSEPPASASSSSSSGA